MGQTSTTSRSQEIIDRHDQYMSINYRRFGVAMVRGQGARLWDADGKSYLDLFAGFGGPILGHCHPDLIRAVTDQAQNLWHPGNLFHSEPQTRAAEAIAKQGFGGRSFFCHSGADANEAAIKLARLHGEANPGPAGRRFGIISADWSFHGRTFGTMPATGDPKVREGFEPLAPGFVQVPYNDTAAVEQAMDEQTAAVLIEPIQGEGGIQIPDDDYLPTLRRLCDDRDLLLICDEVWTGCGRTGRTFGHQHWGIEPDIMTLGKGVGGGLAVGVMCAKPATADLYDAIKHGGVRHASTLGGNCLATAVTATLFEVIERDNLVAKASTLGGRALDRLRSFARAHPRIRQVRGKGLFIGVELDTGTGDTWFKDANQVVTRCLDRGVLINATRGNVLRLAPPLTIAPQELDEGLSVLEDTITG